MGDVLLLSGGPLQEGFAADYIAGRRWEGIVAADRGLSVCLRCGITPDMALGDFDSVPADVLAWAQASFPGRLAAYPVQKDETDTALALQYAIRHFAGDIHILGALGGRLDHTLANMQLLMQARKEGRQAFLLDEVHRMRLLTEGMVLSKAEAYGPVISLFPCGGDVEGLCLSGFGYDVDQITLAQDSVRGISNFLAAERGHITFARGKLLLIECRA